MEVPEASGSVRPSTIFSFKLAPKKQADDAAAPRPRPAIFDEDEDDEVLKRGDADVGSMEFSPPALVMSPQELLHCREEGARLAEEGEAAVRFKIHCQCFLLSLFSFAVYHAASYLYLE